MDTDDDIARARAGDREALDRLLNRCATRLTRLAQSRFGGALRHHLQTSDILQSTYLDVVRSIEQFEGRDEDDFAHWTGRILENNIRDKVRYFGAQRRKGEGADESDTESPNHGPRSQAAIGEDLSLVGQALGRLAEDQREVIVLRLLRGLSYAEVAARMERSEDAVRALVSRARAALLLSIDHLRE